VLVVDVMLCNVLCVGQEQEHWPQVLVVDVILCNVVCVGQEQEQ